MRKYYRTLAEAEQHRKKGERVYYDAHKRGYYIVRFKKRKMLFE